MGGLGPLMNGPAISAIDGWAGPTIFRGPLINGSTHWWMGRIDVLVRTPTRRLAWVTCLVGGSDRSGDMGNDMASNQQLVL